MAIFIALVGYIAATLSFISAVTNVVWLDQFGWNWSFFLAFLLNLFVCIYTAGFSSLMLKFDGTAETHDREITELKKSIRQLKEKLGMEITEEDYSDREKKELAEKDGSWVQDEDGNWHHVENQNADKTETDDLNEEQDENSDNHNHQ